jgi:hypothetical protein
MEFGGLAKRLMKVRREEEYGLGTPLSTLQQFIAVSDLMILNCCAQRGVS